MIVVSPEVDRDLRGVVGVAVRCGVTVVVVEVCTGREFVVTCAAGALRDGTATGRTRTGSAGIATSIVRFAFDARSGLTAGFTAAAGSGGPEPPDTAFATP